MEQASTGVQLSGAVFSWSRTLRRSLSSSRMPANVGKSEFVVERSKVHLLTARKNAKLQRVRDLFSVKITITSSGNESGEWITVEGPVESREKATVSIFVQFFCHFSLPD